MSSPLTNTHKDRIQQYILNELTIVFVANAEGVRSSIIYRIINNLLTFNTYIASRVIKRDRLFAIFSTIRVKLRIFVKSKL